MHIFSKVSFCDPPGPNLSPLNPCSTNLTLHSTTRWSEMPCSIPLTTLASCTYHSIYIPLNQHLIYHAPYHSCVLMQTYVDKMLPTSVPTPLSVQNSTTLIILMKLRKHQLCRLLRYLLSICLDLP